MEFKCLLCLIFSKQWICVDPLKVEAIMNLPPSPTIVQLQILEGKETFLHRFVANYAEITKGFMYLLNKGVPFIWDDQAQWYFDALKHALTTTPLLSPLNYNWYFFLYLDASDSTIGTVLVQTSDNHNERVIYYLSKGLLSVELWYPYIENFALETTYTVQRFWHYILL